MSRAICFCDLVKRLTRIALVLLLCQTSSDAFADSLDVKSALILMLHQASDPLLQHEFVAEANGLSELYERRDYKPLWIKNDGLSRQALQLLQALSAADEEGLNPSDYEAAKLLDAAQNEAIPVNANREAQLDLALSISTLRFVSHLHFGRIDPLAVGFDMPMRSHAFDVAAVLERLSTAEDIHAVLAEIEPPFQHYALLKKALTQYRQLALHPQLTQLPALHEMSIKPGGQYEGAWALRNLLIALGDLTAADEAVNADSVLDEQLADALKRFQFRHGLKQDGALGKETMAALTVPIATRVRQIELTLERWRWLPASDGPTIIVNIPQFRLFAFASKEDRESQMLTMDVIVGKTYPRTHTPAFAADMKYVVFRPYWDVPQSIVLREQLPHIRANPAYLAAEDLEIIDSENNHSAALPATAENITALAAGRLRVRQRPGSNNALGLIKFMLPNKYNVYLHSTPVQQLFSQSRRAFSHGCIRVSDPVSLAEYVLRNAAAEWPRKEIEEAMLGPDNVRVDLKQAVRVLIVYGTAVATESKGIYFFEDIYGNDARLAKLLAK